MTDQDTTLFVRRVLGLDALASGATGLILAFAGGPLDRFLALDPAFTLPAGLFLIVYAVGVGLLAARPRPSRPLVMAVIAINAVWAIDSVLGLMLGWMQPNALGIAFVLAQAAVVAGLAGLQAFAVRPRRRTA